MVNNQKIHELDEKKYIRHKLYSGNKSSFQRYSELVIGKASLWKLIKYELITTLLGSLPGALGLFLRKIFYPTLFKHVGKGTVFGRNITLRNTDKISLGNRVMIDDDCLIDARGADQEGIVIGDEVVINRRVSIQSKIGSISIGSNSDIGADSTIISQGGTFIAEMVTLGGGCKIGGGSIQLDVDSLNEISEGPAINEFSARAQRRFTRGAVRIESYCIFGRAAMVMDGVQVGSRSVIAAGTILREDVPADSVVMTHHKLIVMPRSQFGSAQDTQPMRQSQSSKHNVDQNVDSDKVLTAIYRVLDNLNEQLSTEKRLKKAPEAFLVEPNGPLDSLGLINLVITTEQIIEDEFGKTINLAGDQSELNDKTPFTTVSSFADYVNRVLSS